ncbi:MAG: UvrABC system protein B [Candidatus Heimdallarchaeota archaeon LC_3]|nr:MAG: UvrABC system protein B [Candidatus Heimdallarchaeota archaeon LC_3]
MSLEICEICVETVAKLYRCSKCSQELCMHHYRTHKCSDPNLGLRGERSERRKATIKKDSWEQHLKQNKKYKLEIRDDLTFMVEFPWFPFTNLKAWVPSTRDNYPEEKKSPLDINHAIQGIAKDLNPEEYPQKFLSPRWLQGKSKSWRISWMNTNDYWKRQVTLRTTKFELVFPQFFKEDINYLQKHGVNVVIPPETKTLLRDKQKSSMKDLQIDIENNSNSLLISWGEKVDQWARSLIDLFIDYMGTFFLESAKKWRWIVSIEQISPRELKVPFWAKSRALLFWKSFTKELSSVRISPVKINIENKEQKLAEWKHTLPKQNFKLRPYQKRGINIWSENLFFGSEELPTGSGKTLLGMEAIFQSKTPTLILVPNLDLVEQWKERIKTFLGIPEEEIGLFSGLRKAFENYDIVISTYQLLSQYIKDYYAGNVDEEGNLQKSYDTKLVQVDYGKTLDYEYDEEIDLGFKNENGEKLESLKNVEPTRDLTVVSKTLDVFRNKFGLLIADEAHHVQAETFKEIALHLEIPRRLALSATIEWRFNTGLILATMGPIIFEVRYGRLSKEKYIAPIIYRRLFIKLTLEEQKTISNKKSLAQGFKSKMSRHAENKLLAIREIINAPYTMQILVFTSRVDHAKEIQEYLKENNIEATLLVGEVISNNQEREQILDKFRKKDINALILVKMLNEGFDAPCDTVIIASGSKNAREHTQRIGRATRPGRIAKIFELIVDPQYIDVEWEVAKKRDIKNIIEPWVQDSLVDKNFLNQIEQTFKKYPDNFYLK